MAGTYSQVYIQIVFAVKGRANVIQESWSEELYKYIAGIIKGKNQKSIIVNGYKNHIHILVGLKPSIAISDLVRDIKNNSSKFVNEKKFIVGKFMWQEGYGAFSYNQKQLDKIYTYILNQKEHHHTKTFKEEYLDFLKENEKSLITEIEGECLLPYQFFPKFIMRIGEKLRIKDIYEKDWIII